MDRTESPITHFLLTLLLAFIILGLSYQNKITWLTTPITSLSSPLRIPFYKSRTFLENEFNFLKSIPNQARVIADLKRQNAQLSLDANQVQELKKENESLKSLLAAKVSPNHRVISAKVVGLSRYAILNEGSAAGVTESLPVVIDDILVGVTTSSSANQTQVRLLNDPDTKIEVTTLNGITGLLTPENNTLRLTRVPQKESLSVDTPVFTSGSDGLTSDLLVGHIKQVDNNQSSPYQSAIIEPAAKIIQYQYLFILLD